MFDMHNMVEQPFLIKVFRIDGRSQTTPGVRDLSREDTKRCRQYAGDLRRGESPCGEKREGRKFLLVSPHIESVFIWVTRSMDWTRYRSKWSLGEGEWSE